MRVSGAGVGFGWEEGGYKNHKGVDGDPCRKPAGGGSSAGVGEMKTRHQKVSLLLIVRVKS